MGCLFSRIIGNNFPLSIYLSQEVTFLKNVEMGQLITGKVEIIKDLGRNRYEIETVGFDEEGDRVM